MRWKRTALALTTALTATTMLGCGEDGTSPDTDGQARIQGRIEQTVPEASAYTVARSGIGAASASTSAKTVAVAEVTASGGLNTLAEAGVDATGSFVVEGVPANRENLVVVAKTEAGEIVGRAMVYGRTAAGAVITAPPVTYESSLQAIAYAELKAAGKADMTSAAEVALLMNANSTASAAVLANQEVEAAADGIAVAAEAMTRVYASAGAAFTASARAGVIAQAAVDFARARFNGASADVAHDAFARSSLDAYVGAGQSLEAITMASAAAASTFDARLTGRTSARGALVAQGVRLNLMARQRLAARFQSGAESSVALAVMNVLASAEADVRGASTAAAIRAALDAQATASSTVMVRTMLDFLVPAGSLLLRSQVESRASAAVDAARLSTRLSAAASADAAAQAVANYRSAVRAAVAAMVDASGRADLSVDAMTSLYIAAYGGAHVRLS